MHREIAQAGGTYALREPGEGYKGEFDSESDALRAENTLSWQGIAENCRDIARSDPERSASSMQPAKDLFERGIRIHLELGENRARMPLAVIQQVVTRKDQNGKVWGAQQAIDRRTALLLCTRRAADFIDRTQTIGSIEPGKLADLVVLGGDFLAVPDDEIASIPIEMTMVGGTVVHERGSPKPASVRNPR